MRPSHYHSSAALAFTARCTPDPLLVHTALVRGRALIAEHGLLKGRLGGEDEGFCAWGAIGRALGAIWHTGEGQTLIILDPKKRDAAFGALDSLGMNAALVTRWSDKSTEAEVLARFDKAIEETRPIETRANEGVLCLTS